MAKGQKTGGRDFPKGVSGNPNGRPPVPADIRAARNMTQREFESIANDLLELTRDELTAILENPETPAKVGMIARLIRTTFWSADHKRLAFLLERLIGKVDTKVTAGEPDAPKGKRAHEMTDEELEAEAARIAAAMKKGR